MHRMIPLCSDAAKGSRPAGNLPIESQERMRKFFDPENLLTRDGWVDYAKANVFVSKSLIGLLCEMNTDASLELALQQAIVLNRITAHEMKLFSCIAALLLRMGKEQVAYDYTRIERLKLTNYGVDTGSQGQARVIQTTLLEEEKARYDIWKDIRGLFDIKAIPSVQRMVVWILLLQRWIEDLEVLNRFQEAEAFFVAKLNRDVVDIIRGYVVQTELVSQRAGLPKREIRGLIEELKQHSVYFLEASCHNCPAFWKCLFEGIMRERADAKGNDGDSVDSHAGKKLPDRLKKGLLDHLKIKHRQSPNLVQKSPATLGQIFIDDDSVREAFKVYYPLWRDTPGAVDLLWDFWKRHPDCARDRAYDEWKHMDRYMHKASEKRKADIHSEHTIY
ncbi:hypothetical protein DRE_07584 [Drechslerella stenobrocha 248]|uniref:Uncharacterized protein n=1 Tax=Drechslerella stenobrocha 248 TaxID=1043628 RepID=W7HU23_9PEZI|nr:hypothetical protein DRE_07584 [Drechslerella stenobrocha 248]